MDTPAVSAPAGRSTSVQRSGAQRSGVSGAEVPRGPAAPVDHRHAPAASTQPPVQPRAAAGSAPAVSAPAMSTPAAATPSVPAPRVRRRSPSPRGPAVAPRQPTSALASASAPAIQRQVTAPQPGAAASASRPDRGAAIARVSGGELEIDGDTGRSSVLIPPPVAAPAHIAPAGRAVVSRAATASRATTIESEFAPRDAPSAPAASGMHVDDIYDQLLERLRRDLVIERERLGDVVLDRI